MASLEKELQLLSRSMLGEELRETSDFLEVKAALAERSDPITVSLLWWGSEGERQTVVLHELEDSHFLLFDATRELSSHLDEASITSTDSEGMFKVGESVVESWFTEREALGLLPHPLNESE